MRLIGLVSVFILARLLTPRDFGIVGLAMATLALVDIFSALGLRQALLRIPTPERDHFDTAWTIQLGVLVLLFLVLVALAPGVAQFYGEPALEPVIIVLATRFIFYGLANIGTVEFDRRFEFGRDMKFRLGVRLLSLVVSIAAAFAWRSYWALVAGLVLHSMMFCAASYRYHPHRPRLSLRRRAELLGTSLWIFLTAAAQEAHHQLERLVVGRMAGMYQLGLYSVSKDLSSIFTQEMATALNRVTFVSTARQSATLREQPQRVATMLGTYAIIAAPFGLGLAATGESAIQVLIGGQWVAAAPLLALIAPAGALYAVYKLVVSSLQATGLGRRSALLSVAGFVMLALALGLAATIDGRPAAIALAVLAANLLLLTAGLVQLARTARMRLATVILPVARPFAAASFMGTALMLTAPNTGYALPDLMLMISAGACLYGATLALLWLITGRPEGAEREALTMLSAIRLRTLSIG
ncbi:MAG: oligosaccharide flippase family protein [Sphingosinicella sp.]